MKQLKVIILALLTLSPVAVFAGTHSNGYLTVADTYMYGTMNVRYNPSAPGYIMTQEWSDGTVTFYGTNNTTVFFCYVTPSNPLFTRANQMHFNLDNGSYLYVTRDAGSNVCTYLAFNKASYLLD